jgi:hypothetical protein
MRPEAVVPARSKSSIGKNKKTRKSQKRKLEKFEKSEKMRLVLDNSKDRKIAGKTDRPISLDYSMDFDGALTAQSGFHPISTAICV